MGNYKLTNKQHTDYCEIINNFRCKAIDILDDLTRDYKETLAEEIDIKLGDYKGQYELLNVRYWKLKDELQEQNKTIEIYTMALTLACDVLRDINYKQYGEYDIDFDKHFLEEAKEIVGGGKKRRC